MHHNKGQTQHVHFSLTSNTYNTDCFLTVVVNLNPAKTKGRRSHPLGHIYSEQAYYEISAVDLSTVDITGIV
jgi:hypothetical protein